jgi:hypothetical protein
MTTVKNFINGELVESASGATMPIINPSTGEKYGTAPVSSEAGHRQGLRRGVGRVRRLEAHHPVAPAEGTAGVRRRR